MIRANLLSLIKYISIYFGKLLLTPLFLNFYRVWRIFLCKYGKYEGFYVQFCIKYIFIFTLLITGVIQSKCLIPAPLHYECKIRFFSSMSTIFAGMSYYGKHIYKQQLFLVISGYKRTMKITRETEAYIQCCVEATEHERTGRERCVRILHTMTKSLNAVKCCLWQTAIGFISGVLLGNVISPSPSLHCEEPNEYHFICPKLIIWDPMKRFELKCLKHNASLKPSFWFGKQSPWRQPRLLYDVGGNVLLISR